VSSPPPPAGSAISPSPIEPGRASGGCARGALLGCGVAGVLVLICVAVFLAYARRKPEALTDLMMTQVERSLASDVTSSERERLRAAYAAFRARLRERRVGAEPMNRLREILSTSRGAVGREQVRELTDVFEKAAGGNRPDASGAVATPAPSPAP